MSANEGGICVDDITEIKESQKDTEIRVFNIEKELAVVKEQLKTSNELSRQFMESIEKSSDTMNEIKIAMQTMTMSMDCTKRDITELKEEFKQVKDDQNFNISKWTKDNFVTIAILVTFGGYFLSSQF